MRKRGTRLLCAGVAVLVCGVTLGCFAARRGLGRIGIIGGADEPTVRYLFESGALTPYCIIGAAGLALVIAGSILRMSGKGEGQ